MITETINNISQYLVTTIGGFGYIGIFILMMIESTIFPLPSEVVLVPAGFLAFQGMMNPLIIIILSTLGSLAGSLIMYYLSFQIGRKAFISLCNKYGRIFLFDSSLLVKTEKYFKNHGQITIFISRLLPVLRHLISIPAGFSKMSLSGFILYTTIGSLFWSAILVYFGYYLGVAAQTDFKIVTLSLIAFCIIIILAYIFVKKMIKKVNH